MHTAIIKDDQITVVCPHCEKEFKVYVEVIIDDVSAEIKATAE